MPMDRTLCNVALAIYIIVDTLPKQHQWDPLHSERANSNYAKVDNEYNYNYNVSEQPFLVQRKENGSNH